MKFQLILGELFLIGLLALDIRGFIVDMRKNEKNKWNRNSKYDEDKDSRIEGGSYNKFNSKMHLLGYYAFRMSIVTVMIVGFAMAIR